jgi:hypothetical protein
MARDDDPTPAPPLGASWQNLPVKTVYHGNDPEYANDCQFFVDPMALRLIFTRYFPPLILSSADQQELEDQGYVSNDVVAHVVIPPLLAKRMISQLQVFLERQDDMQLQYQQMLGGEIQSPTEEETDAD